HPLAQVRRKQHRGFSVYRHKLGGHRLRVSEFRPLGNSLFSVRQAARPTQSPPPSQAAQGGTPSGLAEPFRAMPGTSGMGPGGPAARFSGRQRPDSLKAILPRVLGLFRAEAGPLALVALLAVLETLLVLSGPLLIGRAIDSMTVVAAAGSPAALLPPWPVLALALAFAAAACSSAATGWIMAGASQRLVGGLRGSLFTTLTQLPLSTIDRWDHGDLMSRVSNDVDTMSVTLAQSTVQLLGNVLAVVATLAIMLSVNPLLTLASIVPVPLVFLLASTITRRTRGLFRKQQEALGEVNARVEEAITGIAAVKAYGREALLLSQFDEANQRLSSVGSRAQLWTGYLMPIMNVIGNLGYVSVAVSGGLIAVSGGISVGLVATFLAWSRQFVRPLNEIANTWNTLMSAFAGAERVFSLLDEPKEAPDSPDAVDIETMYRGVSTPAAAGGAAATPAAAGGAAADRQSALGDITFNDVEFSYLPGRPVLSGLSFRIAAGSSLAMVGRTGAGKTTMASLLQRFYAPGSGSILIGGLDIARYRKSSLRRAFGVVLQDPWLFSGTVRENLVYGRPEADSEEMARALEGAGAAGMVARLPEGLDTMLVEGGRNLSQGERQLVGLARALLAAPRFLILDEATSSIDARTELHIQERMFALMKGRTSVVIAHRLSTIRDLDRIVVLEDGRVVEEGDHDSLMALAGRYAALVQVQAGVGAT
ncbi:MAG: ABC transporter ATP-binding protein, partial [Spirochaetota bacterium]